MNTFEVETIDELDVVANVIINYLDNNSIVVFNAPMGAGKTTLISKICQILETEENSSSPTYAIYNEYYSPKVGTIYHFDFYRLKSIEEALDAGIEELLDSQKLCFIEWPEKIKKLLPKNYVEVGITVNKNKRIITLNS